MFALTGYILNSIHKEYEWSGHDEIFKLSRFYMHKPDIDHFSGNKYTEPSW